MKKIYLLLIIILGSFELLIGQTLTKTFNPSISQGVKQWYTFGNCGINQPLTYNTTNPNLRSGFYSHGTGCVTDDDYGTLFKFSFNDFSISDIESITFNVNVKMSGVNPNLFEAYSAVLLYPGDCNTSSPENVYNALKFSTNRYLGWLYTTNSSYETKTFTLNKGDLQSILTPTNKYFYIGFIGTGGSSMQICNYDLVQKRDVCTNVILGGGLIDISNFSCNIKYNCTKPSIPAGLTANSVSSSQINLNWTTVAGATGYDIFKCTGTTPLASTTSTKYSLTGLNASTLYSYRIKAKNDCGSSDYSSCASATTTSPVPDPIPADCGSFGIEFSPEDVQHVCFGNSIKFTGRVTGTSSNIGAYYIWRLYKNHDALYLNEWKKFIIPDVSIFLPENPNLNKYTVTLRTLLYDCTLGCSVYDKPICDFGEIVAAELYKNPTYYGDTYLSLNENYPSGFNNFSNPLVGNEIVFNQTDISSDASLSVVYGKSVTINPGFNAHSGSYLNIKPAECFSIQSSNLKKGSIYDKEIKDISSYNGFDVLFKYKIYPNPSEGEFALEFDMSDISIIRKIEIYNISGIKLFETTQIEKINKFSFSTYPKGMYILKITGNEKLHTEKLIFK